MVPSDKTMTVERIELKRKELTTLSTMLVRAAEAYEKGMYDLDWYSMRKKKISDDKEAMEQEILGLENQLNGVLPREEMTKRISDIVRVANQFLDEKDQVKAKSILQSLVDSVVVYTQHDIAIQYRF